MGLQLATAASGSVISDAVAQAHCKVDSNDDLTMVQLYRDAATNAVEKFLKRALLTSAWDLFLDDFPYISYGCRRGEIVPPLMPVTAITSVKYLDTEGVEQTLANNTDYIVDLASKPSRIVPAPDKEWPATQTDRINSVTVRFSAGYADAAAVPAAIKAGILLTLGSLYNNRESISFSNVVVLDDFVTELLSPYINRWHT